MGRTAGTMAFSINDEANFLILLVVNVCLSYLL